MIDVTNMPFTWFLLLTWIVVCLYWMAKPKLSPDAALFLFLLMSIVETVWFTHLTLNLKWVTFKEEGPVFVILILIRNIIRPFLYLFFALSVFVWKSAWARLGGLAGILLFSHLLDRVSLAMGYMSFEHWNYVTSFFMDILMMAFAYAALKGYLRYTGRKEVSA